MRSLFIPTIGTVLILAEDWSFPLHEERRNHLFSENFNLGYRQWARTWNGELPPQTKTVTLPKGTQLKIARLYIRNGGADMKEFDSVTFSCNAHLKGKSAKGAPKGRFWAKLDDVNRILFEDPSKAQIRPETP